MCRQRHIKHLDRTRCRCDQGHQHADGGTFSCTILAKKAIHISSLYRKREVVNSGKTAKLFRKMLNGDDCHGTITMRGKGS